MSLIEITDTVAQMEQDALLQRFVKFARDNHLFESHEKILLAVSGGVDSSVLAHLMCRAQRILNLELAIVHVDHAQRGEASEREALWVEVLAARLNIPFHSVKLKVDHGLSQDELREERRVELEVLLNNIGFKTIVTAHHADDNAETILMRVISGSGVQGLRGMKPIEGLWKKPLLFATRAEIFEYARRNTVAWVEDPSNQRGQYLRNRVRNEVFPLLENLRHGSIANMARLAFRLNQEETEWEHWLDTQLANVGEQFPLSLFEAWPRTLLRRAIRHWMKVLDVFPLPNLVEALLNREELVHEKGVFLLRSDHFVFSRENIFGQAWRQPIPMTIQQRVFLGQSMAWSFLNFNDVKKFTSYDFSIMLNFKVSGMMPSSSETFLIWDKLPSSFVIRKPASSEVTELRRYFETAKIPRPFHREWPLLVSAENLREKIAIIGLCPFEKYAYQGVGRCVALDSFFEERLSPKLSP
ncbi:MAG: tRNA lysidine(34) synthetase TilS [Proteobacteria bacterium]|nr:tRNA lysidine(34) synthetase TilS [Pseudomonadota bacterium]